MVTAAGQGSMLTVLKMFGAMQSPGMLSFPMLGATLTLDFPNRGKPTHTLLSRLEVLVREAGGRVYPAKDNLMTAETFSRGYPQADAFRAFIDPGLNSAFARRIGLLPSGKN